MSYHVVRKGYLPAKKAGIRFNKQDALNILNGITVID